MKLLTKEIEEKFKKYPLGSQDGKGGNAEVLVKYFNPCGSGTWLITEAEKQENGDYLLYGYCHIFEWEWGTVMLSELENLKLPFGLKVERDLYSANCKFIKDYVDYPYDNKKIALRSGYYFLDVEKDRIPFFDKLVKTNNKINYKGEELDLYDAHDYETSKMVDDLFGNSMGYYIDDYIVKNEECIEM